MMRRRFTVDKRKSIARGRDMGEESKMDMTLTHVRRWGRGKGRAAADRETGQESR